MAPQPGMPNGDARTVAYSETLDALGKIKDRLDKSSAELDLPMLCVVGDQTSGKSSLLEALTGVSFPVKSGTCTRMPIVVRCRTADDEPGTTVTLREPDGSERVLPEGGVAKGISKAQDRATKEAKCGFVTNGLRLEARGSGQMELILVDLPGLIHNGDDVEKVRNMVESYIEKPQSLLLLVGEAKQDSELAAAITLAKRHDPHGARTLRVLSKFDNFDSPESQADVAPR